MRRRREPTAFYFLGVTKRLRGDRGALEAFRTASSAAEADDTPSQARAMQAIPELERVPARLEEARVAWVDLRFADAHRNAANPEVGRARVQAICEAARSGAYVRFVSLSPSASDLPRPAAIPRTPNGLNA